MGKIPEALLWLVILGSTIELGIEWGSYGCDRQYWVLAINFTLVSNRLLLALATCFEQHSCVRQTIVLIKIIVFFPMSLAVVIYSIFLASRYDSQAACFPTGQFPYTLIIFLAMSFGSLTLYLLEIVRSVRTHPAVRSRSLESMAETDDNGPLNYAELNLIESFRLSTVCNEEEICSICYSKFIIGEKLKILDCEHFFHGECIDRWLSTDPRCPLCKQNVRGYLPAFHCAC